MLTVAIVEDEPDDARRLDSCLQRYGAERGVDFRLEHFGRPSDFLDSYKARYDLVFMDIEMPGMDGLSAAKRLRQFDQEVILIFVTNLAQYASRGYEVNALDYVMKPMEYQTFERKMDRAVRACWNNSDSVIVAQRGYAQRILLRNIKYIEVHRHDLRYHMESPGERVLNSVGSMQEASDRLGDKGFLRCDRQHLVNVRQIESISGSTVTLVDGDELPIGRAYKKDFFAQLAQELGAGYAA